MKRSSLSSKYYPDDATSQPSRSALSRKYYPETGDEPLESDEPSLVENIIDKYKEFADPNIDSRRTELLNPEERKQPIPTPEELAKRQEPLVSSDTIKRNLLDPLGMGDIGQNLTEKAGIDKSKLRSPFLEGAVNKIADTGSAMSSREEIAKMAMAGVLGSGIGAAAGPSMGRIAALAPFAKNLAEGVFESGKGLYKNLTSDKEVDTGKAGEDTAGLLLSLLPLLGVASEAPKAVKSLKKKPNIPIEDIVGEVVNPEYGQAIDQRLIEGREQFPLLTEGPPPAPKQLNPTKETLQIESPKPSAPRVYSDFEVTPEGNVRTARIPQKAYTDTSKTKKFIEEKNVKQYTTPWKPREYTPDELYRIMGPDAAFSYDPVPEPFKEMVYTDVQRGPSNPPPPKNNGKIVYVDRIDLTPDQKIALVDLRERIASAEEGMTLFREDKSVGGLKSSFPVKDLKVGKTSYGKEKQLEIIDKVLNGKYLTEKQDVVFGKLWRDVEDKINFLEGQKGFTPTKVSPLKTKEILYPQSFSAKGGGTPLEKGFQTIVQKLVKRTEKDPRFLMIMIL